MVKSLAVGMALTIAAGVWQPTALFAKGSGGHGGSHGGGHSGSGHGSGGHASGGHASGSHGGAGHAGGGHTASAGRASRGGTVTRGSGSSSSPSNDSHGARPRDGRPVVGTAVPRTGGIPPVGASPLTLDMFRTRLFYGSSFRFNGLGLYGYPLWTGSSYGSGSVYDYGLSDAAPYQVAPDPFDRSGPTGKLRLRIEPKDAAVYVDGYYAGIVDDFDGHFQHLDLSAGPHRVEIRAPGYVTLVFDVVVAPHRTIQYRGELQR